MKEILNKIIKECPEAWGEWCKVIAEKPTDKYNGFQITKDILIDITFLRGVSITYISSFNMRDFYDYFDGKDIIIEIEPTWNGFRREVYTRRGGFINGEVGYTLFNTRTEAEWNAFYEAFKIREVQLNGK